MAAQHKVNRMAFCRQTLNASTEKNIKLQRLAFADAKLFRPFAGNDLFNFSNTLAPPRGVSYLSPESGARIGGNCATLTRRTTGFGSRIT